MRRIKAWYFSSLIGSVEKRTNFPSVDFCGAIFLQDEDLAGIIPIKPPTVVSFAIDFALMPHKRFHSTNVIDRLRTRCLNRLLPRPPQH